MLQFPRLLDQGLPKVGVDALATPLRQHIVKLQPERVTGFLLMPYDDAYDLAVDRARKASYTIPVFTGAVSGIKLIAINPATSATSRYQDGAIGSPVTCNNQVTTSWAVPPKLAIATA